MPNADPRPYLTGILNQLAAANAAGDTDAAEAIVAQLIDDNDPAARAALADALHLQAARDGAPDNPPPNDSTPDTP